MAEQTTAVAERPALPDAITRRGIDEAQWRTLMGSLFPGAKSESVLLVVDYCRARRLDPMKKPCHIVPMRVKNQQSGEWEWRDVVMPGIYEYRTTAMRTGNYLGHSKPEYGPTLEVFGVTAPEWCEMTIYRRATNGDRIEFPVRVYFREACATNKEGKANDRWSKAPIQMLTKCAEAAGLREAFPDEFGGEVTAEEMDGQQQAIVDVELKPIQPGQRKSQLPPAITTEPTMHGGATPATATPTTEPLTSGREAAPASTTSAAPAALNIGVIVEVIERQGGAALVLNTGFKCSTNVADNIAAAKSLRDAQRLVELVTTPSADPTKYMPRLTEIQPIAEDVQP